MVYKRGINKLEKLKKTEYIMASNLGTYVNSSVTGEIVSPLHGLYIKQLTNSAEIYVSKMIEKYEINGKEYSVYDINTNENSITGKEYLESFDRYPVPTYTYYIDGCKIVKKYKYVPNTNVLCVEYELNNSTKKTLRLNSMPCITKRDILKPKRKQEMKFNSNSTVIGTKIALSISENINIYLKTNNMKFNSKEEYICGVNYDLELNKDNLKTFVDDLYIPGNFEANVRPGNTKTVSLYIMLNDESIEGLNSRDIEIEYVEEENRKIAKIDEAYFELRKLALNAYNFQYIDREQKRFVICESMPEIKESKEYIKHVICSLEGNYMLLGRYKEAKKILEAMMKKLEDENLGLNEEDKVETILFFIEVLNRYIQLSECDIEEIHPLYTYIKNKITEYISGREKETNVYVDELYFLSVNNKKYIKINSLWHNALKIYVHLSEKFNEVDVKAYEIVENLSQNIINEFWDEGAKVLKYELEDTAYPNFDMIYSQSLSYPIIKDEISMKIMDTAFKELYTPLGMRLFGVRTEKYDGYVYPHLIVHFIKANLRQMGVTRATQKLAFNLVKDLLAEIDVNTIGSVKYKYLEKNKTAYGQALSAITNAELIRMYDMLT